MVNRNTHRRALAAGALLAALCGSTTAADIGCYASAQLAFVGCGYSTRDDYFVDRAKCLSDPGGDLTACLETARETLGEGDEECTDILDARLTLCESLNDAAHVPAFGTAYADRFVDPLQIGVTVETNPYFPLTQGNTWDYEGTFTEDGEEVTENIHIEVLNRTKLIDGITCVVVRDTVTVDDELVEDTDDWFAQDVDGNVWYCGEEVKDYETFEDDVPPEPELVSNDGSFKAGRDGAEPGISLPGIAEVGAIFRQENDIANAEDIIEILSTTGSETAAAASCDGNCMVTRDTSPLDPDVEENKYYLPGVGKIVEIKVGTDQRVELIDYNVN
ncbi:MAG: hypothetical protein H6993_15050 [Pseudomonadales bacterium]|nr:hypothetical protein [Pseudomonadales bacterium]MCP5185281.1 hypothetical protein [Pseudomonadales bacterium]